MADLSTASAGVPVCGIGASAGGVEALQVFFRHVPSDLGLAYIVVMHLAPDRHSELPAIIARWTTMPVIQVADRAPQRLMADHVYVTAPDRALELSDSSIASSPFAHSRDRRAAIDLFFRSLAVTHGDGFAVVLSGSGSDGAVGARAVKERGGLVLVQEPSEAAHGGMPRAAINTGVADLVLPVEELVGRLAELTRNRHALAPAIRVPEGQAPIPADEAGALARLFDLLRTRTGHDFSGYKRSTALRRISRRMQLTDQRTIVSYVKLLRRHASELQTLFDDLLISVTSFFRDPEAWDALRRDVIRPLVEHSPPLEPLRVWMPGCATGEEAYTLAILFQEELDRREEGRELTIFATDVDKGALTIGREGLYPSAISADVSDERLERFFRADGDHYRVISDVRDRVVFAAHSILRDPPFSRVHLVSCRNLLVYLEPALQDQVTRVFRYACRDDGFLFLGSAETVDADLFQAVDATHHVFRASPALRRSMREIPELWKSRASAAPPSRRPDQLPIPPAELHLAALEDGAPPTVLADERWNVLHVSPSAARYFQQRAGPLALKLPDVVRPELREEVLLALSAAMSGTDASLSAFARVQFDDTSRRVGVLVQGRSRNEQRQFLVTFLDAGAIAGTESVDEKLTRGTVTTLRDKLQHAERHIENIRDDYYLTTEELRAVNEELQSVNEEQRSTTEELETSKEELQSTNEELQTINQELRLRLEQVSRAHSDIENLMAATNVATLFLDTDLRIKRYTRQLADIFTIRPRDVDRPIADLRHTLAYQTLEADARRVLTTLSTEEAYTTGADGRLFIVRMTPYRTVTEHRVDGVVLTFIDITDIKRAEVAVRESAESKAETLQVRDLLSRLVHVQEEERRRISRDIHDQMGQQMTALRMQIESLRMQWTGPPDLLARLRRVESLAEELDQSLDYMTWELRPAALDRLGLSAALADMVRSWSDRCSVPAEYHATAGEVSLPPGDAVNLYRIVQESLHNISKHADASQVTVLLRARDGQLTLVVEDDGRGFARESNDPDRAEGLGLISMRERARLIGGQIEIETAPGRGTSIFVRVPLDPELQESQGVADQTPISRDP